MTAHDSAQGHKGCHRGDGTFLPSDSAPVQITVTPESSSIVLSTFEGTIKNRVAFASGLVYDAVGTARKQLRTAGQRAVGQGARRSRNWKAIDANLRDYRHVSCRRTRPRFRRDRHVVAYRCRPVLDVCVGFSVKTLTWEGVVRSVAQLFTRFVAFTDPRPEARS